MGKGKELALVRERLNQLLDSITQVEDLEFVELAATLTDITFSEEMAVEFYLDVSRYIARVQARHERAKAKSQEIEGKGGAS